VVVVTVDASNPTRPKMVGADNAPHGRVAVAGGQYPGIEVVRFQGWLDRAIRAAKE
jgi:hypothetical protein